MPDEITEYYVGEKVYRKDDNFTKTGIIYSKETVLNDTGRVERTTYTVKWDRSKWPSHAQDDDDRALIETGIKFSG